MTEKNRATWAALLGMILHLMLGGLTFAISVSSGSSACLALGFFTVITALVWGTALLHTRQRRLAEEEDLDLAETEKRGAMFEDQDLGTLSAKAGLRRLELYLLPVATTIIAGLLIAISIFLAVRWGKETPESIADFFMPGAIVFAFGAVLLFYGMYVKGMTAVAGWRLLRAGSSVTLFAAFASLLTSVTVILTYLGMSYVEPISAWIVCIVTGIAGLDLIFSMITGIFVPRVPGAERLPPYYSRVLDMITSPGDILKTVADMVDYQFGFKVSETWFYEFLEKAIIPLLAFWVLTVYIFTCIVIIGPEEQGVRERFGSPHPQVLDSGFHIKMPWPIDAIYTFPAKAVQVITIGFKGELKDQAAITWTEKHYEEEDTFLVATRESRGKKLVDGEKRDYVPVSFVTAAVIIHYRVESLHRYIYQKSNPRDFITDIAYREVVKFLGSIDIFDLLKEKRLILAKQLRGNVEEVLRDADIGVEVLHLGFESAHPPVEVGEAYESVIKALEEKHTAVLKAQTYTNEITHRAAAEAYEIEQKARAYKARRTGISAAEAKRFAMVKKAYDASPNVFTLRKYMSAFEEGTENIRKYVIPPDSKVDSNIILNLEDKLQFGVEDIDFGTEEEGG